MVNVSSRVAVGGTVQYAHDGYDYRVAIKPRVRWWLTHPFSVDASAGVIVAGENLSSSGVTGHLGVIYSDLIGLSAVVESYEPELLGIQERRTDLYFGIRLLSWAGAVGAGLAALAVKGMMGLAGV
jgi:hypothetical protein